MYNEVKSGNRKQKPVLFIFHEFREEGGNMKHTLGMVVLSVVLQATSCGTTYQEAQEQKANSVENSSVIANARENYFDDFGYGYFTKLLGWSSGSYKYAIVYANDTKVKYLVFRSGDSGGITPLYNADGSLQVYDGSSEEFVPEVEGVE